MASSVVSLVIMGRSVTDSYSQDTEYQSVSQSVAFPEGYRDWRHVKTQVWNEGHPLYEAVGGMHHIYANKKALAGYETGDYEDGAKFVFDLLDVDVADGAIAESKRKAVFVMVRDWAVYRQTGGWGYEGFSGDDRKTGTVGEKAYTACHSCHLASKDSGYIMSRLRD